MKHYYRNSRLGDGVEYLDILREIEDGYCIRVTRFRDGSALVFEETIPRHLFNLCVKTGCIHELTRSAPSVA
jgi:hypothetical protein